MKPLLIVRNLLLSIVFTLFMGAAFAIEPEEFCDGPHATAAKEDPLIGICEPCGPKCVRLKDGQAGNVMYKKCPDESPTCIKAGDSQKECQENCPECSCD